MVTFTTNKALGLPSVGGDTGVWGPPLNNNSSVLDASLGGFVNIPISSVSGALTLLASNYINTFLGFTGAITQNTVITLPAVGSFYTVRNITTNTSQFTVTLQTTAAGGAVIGIPPYQSEQVYTDGANLRFQSQPNIGTYWDYAGSSVPSWVSACTTPPWLNCDGTAFSSATYPYLATILGSTTLPDCRGRGRITLNQGTGRVTSSQGGVDGNTLLAAGGTQTVTLSSQNIPLVPITDPGHSHNIGALSGEGANSPVDAFHQGAGQNTGSAVTGITAGSSSPTFFSNMHPALVSGITMIRSG